MGQSPRDPGAGFYRKPGTATVGWNRGPRSLRRPAPRRARDDCGRLIASGIDWRFAFLAVGIDGIWIGVGTRATGALSDALQLHYGDDSLRYAILAGTGFYVLASALFFLSSRWLERDWEGLTRHSKGAHAFRLPASGCTGHG